jgi:hypothetical protein
MTARIRAAALAGIALSVALTACSRGGSVAEVYGTVTLNGQPVSAGTVVFTGPTDSATAVIEPDGSYRARNVPRGPVRVLVSEPPLAVGPGGAPVPQPALPAQYRDANTSGLELTVAGGRNPFDIAMTTR